MRSPATTLSRTTAFAEVPAALLVTVPEAARALRVGRTKVYELIERGALQSVKIDGSRRVVAASLEAYVALLISQIR